MKRLREYPIQMRPLELSALRLRLSLSLSQPQTLNIKPETTSARAHDWHKDTKARITSNSCQTRPSADRQSNFQTIYIQTPWLNKLREYFLVHALIGSGYTPYDLLFYVFGGIIGYVVLKEITKCSMNNLA